MKLRLAIITFISILLVTASQAAADDGFDRDSLKITDVVVLKSGESLDGTIVKVEEDGKSPVSFRTQDGIDLLLDKKLISKIIKTDDVAKRYNDAIATLADSAEAHRDMIDWLEEQDNWRIRFKQQVLFHNKRIIRLAPNDKAARRQLGYAFLKDENRWVPEEQYWTSRGYVRAGAKWVPDLHERIEQNQAQSNEVYSAKKQKLNLWKRNLRKMSAGEAVNQLLALADRSIMPDIFADYEEETNSAVKAVYIEVFAAARPVHSLQVKGLVDAVINLKSDKALDYLMQDDFNKRLSAEYLTSFLQDKSNVKINRAAFALGELESRNAILALANALKTKHKTSAGDPGRMSTSFNNVTGGSQQFGSKKAVATEVSNKSVLEALKKITGQEFGYSKDLYQRWYIKNYTLVGLKARR